MNGKGEQRFAVLNSLIVLTIPCYEYIHLHRQMRLDPDFEIDVTEVLR